VIEIADQVYGLVQGFQPSRAVPLSDVGSQLFVAMQAGATDVAGRLVPGARLLLAATTGIALLRIWFEVMLDDSLAEGIGDGLNVVVIAIIALSAINNTGPINAFVWRIAGELLSVTSGVEQSAGSFVGNLWNRGLTVVGRVWDAASQLLANVDGGDSSWWNFGAKAIDAALAGILYVVNLLVSLVVTVLFAVYFLIMLFQLFVGGFRLAIIGSLYPIAVGFTPVFSRWALNAISGVASAVAHIGAIGLLISFSDLLVEGAAESLAVNSPTWSGLQLAKMVILVMAGLFITVMGLATSTALSAATALFDGAGGMVGALTRRGGGGGRRDGGGGGGGKDSAGGPSPGGGEGAKVPSPAGGGGAGGGAAGGSAGGGGIAGAAARAGASLASGGATAAASVASGAAKAGGAVSGALSSGGKAAGGAVSGAAQRAGQALAAGGGPVGAAAGKALSSAGQAAGRALSGAGSMAGKAAGAAISGGGAASAGAIRAGSALAGKGIAAGGRGAAAAGRAAGSAGKAAGSAGRVAAPALHAFARNTLRR